MIPGFYIFHSPEINFLIFVTYAFTQNSYLFFLLLSNLIHLSLDIVEHYKYHKNFDFIKKWSFLIQLKNIV